MSKAVKISDGNFNREVIKADKPVLVDFYADWCSPCKMIKPIVEDIANEYEDQVKVCKLDVDGNQKTAAKYIEKEDSLQVNINKIGKTKEEYGSLRYVILHELGHRFLKMYPQK